MQKTYFELLRHYLRLAPDTELLTSRVTSYAVINQFHEQLQFHVNRAERGALNIADFTGSAHEPQDPAFVEKETERYKEYYDKKINELNLKVILFRNLNFDEVLKRCFHHHSIIHDFDFKHILNWEALLQAGLEPGIQVAAITTRAQQLIVSEEPVLFESDSYDCTAHNKFIQRLNPDLPEWRRITLFPSLYAFLDKHLMPLLELHHDKLNLLNDQSETDLFHAYIDNWIVSNKHLLTVELEQQLDTIFAPSNIRPHKHSLRIHAMDNSPSSITYMDVYALDAHTLFWPIRIKLYAMMSFDADPDASSIVKTLDPTQAHLMAQTRPNSFCNIFAKIEIPLQLSFIWDTETKNTTHQQITFLPIQRWCPTCGEPLTDLSPSTCPVCHNLQP